jgi:hypothetical protein
MITKSGDFDLNSTLCGRIGGIHFLSEKQKLALKQRMCRSTLDRYRFRADDNNASIFASEVHPGDVRMDKINELLRSVYRSTGQKEFHKTFLSTCLRLIYEDAYESQRHRIMCKYGFENKKQQALVCAPRRFGKSHAVSHFAIVLALVLDGVEISIFSPGKRQSVALMGHIFNFMKKLKVADRVIRKNEEKMIVRTLSGGEAVINAYPSAVKTLKGVSGTVVILEEVAAIDPAVLYEVVCPLHQIEVTAFIGISTITTADNFFTKYLELLDPNGDTVFAVKYIFLACEKCRENGLASSCKHNNFMLPGWSSARKRRVVNRLMSGKEDMLAREIGGVASKLHEPAFLPKLLALARDKPRYELSPGSDYPVIFISVDPNAAGKESDFAIMSVLCHEGRFVIIGMETFQSKSARENHAMLIAHLNELKGMEVFTNSLKVFILESNLAMESEHISATLNANVSNYLVMHEKPGRVGFLTTNGTKKMSVEMVRTRLCDGSFTIAAEGSLACLSHDYGTIVRILFEQLGNFSQVIKEHPHKKPTTFFSAKHMGKDDLAMTLLFSVMWIPFFFNTPEYSHYY